MTTLTHASKLFAPRRQRAASLRQVWSQRVSGWARALWASLEATGQRRAAPYLLHEASRQESSNPALAAELRRVARAAAPITSRTTSANTPAQAR